MNIQIISTVPFFPSMLAKDLGPRLEGDVCLKAESADRALVTFSQGVDAKQREALLDALLPMRFAVEDGSGASGAQVFIPDAQTSVSLSIKTDTQEYERQLQAVFAERLGLNLAGSVRSYISEDVMTSNHLGSFTGNMVKWVLNRQFGVSVTVRNEEKELSFGSSSDDEEHITIAVSDPCFRRLEPKQKIGVRIITDDLAKAKMLRDVVLERGYQCHALEGFGQSLHAGQKFSVETGWLSRPEGHTEANELMKLVETFLAEHGVDAQHYPLEVVDSRKDLEFVIYLPLEQYSQGQARPYAGDIPSRFVPKIISDEEGAADLLKGFTEAGFAEAEEALLSGEERLGGFRVCLNNASFAPKVKGAVIGMMKAYMSELGASDFELRISSTRQVSESGDVIEIFCPQKGIADGSLLQEMASPKRFDLRFSSPDFKKCSGIIDELQSWGFKRVRLDEDENPFLNYAQLRHGQMTPPALLSRIVSCLEEKAGIQLQVELDHSWDADDNDIYLALPGNVLDRMVIKGDTDGAVSPVKRERSHLITETKSSPFLALGEDGLQVGAIKLPYSVGIDTVDRKLIPDPKDFGHFCIDSLTAGSLEHIAASVIYREPCLLEGGTCTSKTSSIQYLASLLGQPVARFNLSAITDATELIGKFVPANSIQHDDASGVSCYASAKPGWRFQFGLLVQAMLNGWWLILDEINLAEAHFLERINPVLEASPSLVLTEYDNTIIGGESLPVHKNFRIFATMNPASYTGRAPLSPAFKDRWLGYRYVSTPREKEYREMLNRMAYGTQPEVECSTIRYNGEQVAPVYPALTDSKTSTEVLAALARFQTSAFDACQTTGVAGSSDGIVVTRRSLLACVEYLNRIAVSGENDWTDYVGKALERYYFGRAVSASARNALEMLAASMGLIEMGQSDD